MRTMSQCRTVRVKSSKQFLRLGLVVLTLMAATASASTIYVYDIRMNEGGFFGDLQFSEPEILTAPATISDFERYTLTSPDGFLADYAVVSPVATSPAIAASMVSPMYRAFMSSGAWRAMALPLGSLCEAAAAASVPGICVAVRRRGRSLRSASPIYRMAATFDCSRFEYRHAGPVQRDIARIAGLARCDEQL